MVGFHINSFINQDCNENSNISKEFQSFEIKTSNNCLEYKSDISALKNSINSNYLSNNYRNYECLICRKVFNEKNRYQTHMRTHGKSIDPYRCNICEKSFAVPARLTRHYRTHTGEKPYQCEYCNKSFSVKENLSVHRRIHTKERPYKCDICNSAFEHSGKLHRHMRIHTGERPHKCSLCSKTFIQSGQLVIHMRTHTGEKPYICNSCGKGFTCSKQLKVHTRTHTGERPYKCDICGKSFGYNHVLKLHQVAHYGEKFYKCTLCEETFNSKKLMEIHIKFHSDSSIKNYSQSSQVIVDNIKHIDNNNIFIMGNKKESKKLKMKQTTKSFELRNKTEFSNNIIYDPIFQHRNETNNQKVSNIINNQSCLSISTNVFISKHLNNVDTDAHFQDISRNKRYNHQCFFSDLNPIRSCIYEIETNDFFDKEYIPTLCLSSNRLEKSVGSHIELLDEKHKNNNTNINSHENFTSSMYTNHFNLVIPSVKNNFSLPPRKRCKMILESMETQQIELVTTKRYNSVIRFAKADNTYLANN